MRMNFRDADVPVISPADASAKVEAGDAILVDVREADEWSESGVAEPALLLSMTDFRGERLDWNPVLARHKDKHFILYCASGMRSAMIAEILQGEGYRVANLGGFGRWAYAGLPVRKP